MLQGLKSKKRHLILLSDVLNISNKSLTMALYSSRKKNCVVRTQHSSSNDYEVFFQKSYFHHWVSITHVLIKVIHSRRIKKLLSLFFAHFLSFCSHFVSVARLFFTFRRGSRFSNPILLQVLTKRL